MDLLDLEYTRERRDFAYICNGTCESVEMAAVFTDPSLQKCVPVVSFRKNGKVVSSVIGDDFQAHEQLYNDSLDGILNKWAGGEGQVREIADLFRRNGVDYSSTLLGSIYAVGAEDSKAEPDSTKFYFPAVDGNIVRYTVDGKNVYSVYFNSHERADEFHERALGILLDQYEGRMRELAQKQAANKKAVFYILLPNNVLCVIEWYDDIAYQTVRLACPQLDECIHLWHSQESVMAATRALALQLPNLVREGRLQPAGIQSLLESMVQS